MSILAIRSNRRQVGKQFQCLHISLCSRSIELNVWVQVRTGRTTVTTCNCLIRRLPKQSLRLAPKDDFTGLRDRDAREPPGGGGGVLNNCLQYGEATPRGPTPHPFTIFHEKGTPSVYLLLRNGTPLNLVALCISFNCCKCTVFYIGINHNKIMFSRLF